MRTPRQQIMDRLRQESMTALELSQALRLPEKDVYRHLAHVQKTIAGRRGKLTVTPSSCRACGYTFTDRRRLTRPGRCPRCRESRIDHPVFRIAPY
ncbi:transcriptional regulator [Desulfosarcina alkanivorans]|nr:transcriptional regulator [Desulfosarcina alkanivorans]